MMYLRPFPPGLATVPASTGTETVFWILVVLLIVASVTILVVQVMIVRQIGVLHLRLGPEMRNEPAPTRTQIETITFDNGTVRVLNDHRRTACLLVSSTCEVCNRLLAELAAARRLDDWIVGVAGGPASPADLRRQFGLAEGLLFDGRDLARDIRVISVPLFLLLDSNRNVVHRAVVDSIEAIERKFLNPSAKTSETVEPVSKGVE